MRLAVRVRDASACEPIESAVVEIWHCDASGAYSGFGSEPGGERSDGERYLRGAQVTNADGLVEFVAIYPGWYRGRTTHIHAKVHVSNEEVLTRAARRDLARGRRLSGSSGTLTPFSAAS